MRGRTVAVALAALAITLAAATATAGAATRTKRILPLQFHEWSTDQDSARGPVSLSSPGADIVEFHAPLPLPVGARITKVVLWSRSSGVASRSVNVVRFGPGRHADLVAGGSDTTASSTAPVAKEITPYSTPTGITTIQPGYRYDVMAIMHPGAHVWAVDVTYLTP